MGRSMEHWCKTGWVFLEKRSRKITYTINGISLDADNNFYQIDT
jgi:hypothetical protein